MHGNTTERERCGRNGTGGTGSKTEIGKFWVGRFGSVGRKFFIGRKDSVSLYCSPGLTGLVLG